MSQIAFILMLAVLCEALVEYAGTPIPQRWKPYAAALVGVIVALLYGVDVFALVASQFGQSARIPYVGEVLSGILLGRGSNYINDLISRLQMVRLPAAPIAALEEQKAP